MFNKSKTRRIRELEQKLGRTETNHILHLLLSIVTAGLWLPVWILASLNNAGNRRVFNNMLDKELERV